MVKWAHSAGLIVVGAHTRNEMGDARAWLSGASAQPSALTRLTCYLLLDDVVNLFDHAQKDDAG